MQRLGKNVGEDGEAILAMLKIWKFAWELGGGRMSNILELDTTEKLPNILTFFLLFARKAYIIYM